MITERNFVSISDLRDNTSAVLKDVNMFGKKIVLSQNKPIGVFLSIVEYNHMQKLSFEKEKATPEDITAYAKSSHGDGGVEAFSFLETLR
jgi:PHD/YefM family antitoxin component YafN of YafNO toxin-antitoxin module